MADTESLSLLFKKVAEGDQKSLESLFNLFHGRLLGFIINYVKNKEAAEEVVSDVFLNFWQHKEKLVDVKQYEIYLFICAKNAALNYVRKSGKLNIVSMDDHYVAEFTEITDPLKELENKELMLKMDLAIESLPAQCKAVFRLAKEQGFKCKEIASIMEISPRTVEAQIYKAVKRLDEVLERNNVQRSKSFFRKNILHIFL